MPRNRTRAATQHASGPTPKRTRTAAPDTNITRMSQAELGRLPIEVLRLHLQDQHLVTTGNKATLSKRLYTSLHAVTPRIAPAPTSTTNTATQPPTTSQPPVTPLAALHNHSEQLIDGSLRNCDGTIKQLLGALIQTARTMQQQPLTSPPAPQPPPAEDNISLPSALPVADPQLGEDIRIPTQPQLSLSQPTVPPLPPAQLHHTPMPAITDKLKQII